MAIPAAHQDLLDALERGYPRETLDDAQFRTHLLYIRLVAGRSQGLVISTKGGMRGLADSAAIQSKRELIRSMRKSLKDEIEISKRDSSYAESCSVWISAKAYYLLHHRLTLFLATMHGDAKMLTLGHRFATERFASLLAKGDIRLSDPILAKAVDRSNLEWKTRGKGAHLRADFPQEDLFRLMMKKTADEYTRSAKRTRRSGDKSKKVSDVPERMCFLDFFLAMRMRTNYRDASFVKNIEPGRIASYVDLYHRAALRIDAALASAT